MVGHSRRSIILRLCLAFGMAGAFALAGPAAPVDARADARTYVPTESDMATILEGSGYTASWLATEGEGWDAAVAYHVAFQDVKEFELFISASVFTSYDEAKAFFAEVIDTMLADNEVARHWVTYPEDADAEGHDFRLIYIPPGEGRRVSNYARLLQVGCTVAIVEAIGSPASDDEGYPDSDRGLIMTQTSRIVNGRMIQFPPPCTN